MEGEKNISNVFIAKDMFGEKSVVIQEGKNGDVFLAQGEENDRHVIVVKKESLAEFLNRDVNRR